MKYIVYEMQTASDGTVTCLTYQFDTRNEAESKYHHILSFAAITTLPCHAAMISTNTGELIASAYYGAEPVPPEPEPEPTPEPEPESNES